MIEDCEFDQGHRTPQRQSLKLVVVPLAINAEELLLQLACILTNEVGYHQAVENRMQNFRAAVVHRDTFCAVLRANPQKMLGTLAQEFDGFDDHGVFKA